MGASGLALVIQRMITVSVFKLVRLAIMFLQTVIWHFNGTTRKTKEAFDPKHFERCVRVLNVKVWHKFDLCLQITLGDFICTRDRFESPQYIFDSEHVTLITLSPDYAIFGEAKQTGMQLWRSDYSSFVRFAQLEYCNKLLLVPLYAFNLMANRLGDPSGELIFLFNVSRCGSTLLTQMMEYTGQCVSISEPEPPNILNQWFREKGDSEDLRRLTKSSVRWICRPYKNFNPLAYVLKLSATTARIMHPLKEIYPNSHYIFMYRDMLTVAKSFYRLSRELPSAVLVMIFGRLHESIPEKIISTNGCDGTQFRFRFQNDLTMGFLLYICMAKSYLELYHEGLLHVRAARYEDIISDPSFAMRSILRHCNLPESLVENALKGMERDSQRNSIASKKILQRHRALDITVKEREVISEIARRNGLPGLDEDSLLPGTITTKLQAI